MLAVIFGTDGDTVERCIKDRCLVEVELSSTYCRELLCGSGV